MNKANKKKKYIRLLIFIASFFLFFFWQNNHIVITEIDYNNSKIPEDFKDFTILQVSDLHNKSFGRGQKYLLNKIKSTSPDIIVITGDLIDRRKYDLETAMVFIKGAEEIAPIYYVSGNHEAWSGQYENIKKELLKAKVSILDDSKIHIKYKDGKIELLGLSDPDFLTSNYLDGTDLSKLLDNLESMADEGVFQILLSHRPELFHLYAEENIDLIFAGHAHGGQFRIPYLGGLVAPDQGLFPEYTSGKHIKGKSTMIVNRGLGNSIIPLRIFNRPEIIKVILQNTE